MLNNTEIAQFVKVIGRSFRYNPPVGTERVAGEAFLAYEQVKRPWLKDNFINNTQGGTYTDSPDVLGKQINLIGVNIATIKVLDAEEQAQIDALFAATGNRMWGDQANTANSCDTIDPLY